MAAYVIAHILEILDPAKTDEYRLCVGATIASCGGLDLVRGDGSRVVEGDWQPRFPVGLEFPSLEQAERWYHSESCRDLKALRQAGARSNLTFIAGVEGSATGR